MSDHIKNLTVALKSCMRLLTRLPVGPGGSPPVAQVAWAFPLVGLVVGGGAALVAALALAMGLPAAVAALLATLTPMILTGALHEDGLADTADGLWGGWTRERRLEIMRDSRIGSYGVLALIGIVALKWTVLTALIEGGALWGPVLACAAASRAAMVPVMALVPPARPDGLGRGAGRPSGLIAAAALGLAGLIALIGTGAGFVAITLGAAAPSLALVAIARRRIGGQTGDILGATQQLAEAGALIGLAALLA